MHSRTFLWTSLMTITFSAACAGTPGAQPHDMSVEGHERAAAQAEAAARQHAGEFNPAATGVATQCTKGQVDPGLPCWSVLANPTEEHLAQAERLRKAAADHRAASQALRDAEASACTGIADADRDTSPLQHPADVTAVEELYLAGSSKAGIPGRLTGAAVVLLAVPGLTKEYLQRLVTCHVARNSSMGHSMPAMATCPLAVKGASATVESALGRFRVEVRSEDQGAAAEIVKRARTLAPGAAPQ